MPIYRVVLEAVADGQKITHELMLTMPTGSTGVDLVRAAEAFAARRGWRHLVVGTGSNGTVLPETTGLRDPALPETVAASADDCHAWSQLVDCGPEHGTSVRSPSSLAAKARTLTRSAFLAQTARHEIGR